MRLLRQDGGEMNVVLHRAAIAPSLALFVLGMVGACHREKPDPLERCAGLVGLPQHDPVADADAAFARHDARVLMLGGYGSSAPGVGAFGVVTKASDIAEIAPYSPGTHFVIGRLLPGTSDFETRACFAAKHASRPYVFAYNRRMLSHLSAARP